MLLCKRVDKAVHTMCTAFVYGTKRLGDYIGSKSAEITIWCAYTEDSAFVNAGISVV